MDTAYLETTILSYLSAHPSRDLIVAGHQQITYEWWNTAKDKFRLFISEAVLEEIAKGDPDAIIRRKEIAKGLSVLRINDDVRMFAGIYEKRLEIPDQAKPDVIHIAFAVAYKMDYLLTWNCSHIANGKTIKKLISINQDMGRPIPIILTPEELLEGGEKI
jgi:hypothetical protein